MLLVSKEAVPDHIRRGIRLGIAILILSSIGFSIVGREGCENWVPVFKWGLLTCPVVTMPLLGKTSQVSFERALGTVVGGTLGFFATALSTHWWTLDATETDDIFLSIVAASAAYLAIMVGKRLSLDLSSKLFTIAFILVCFSSQEGRDPKVVAITRVGGIVLGVVTMLILSVLVLPKSASIESLRTLRKSLNKLQDVNRIAWGNYLPPEHQAAQLVAAGASQAHEQQQRRVNGRARGEDSALAQPLLGPEDVEAGQPARPALVLDLDDGCASPMPPEAAEAHVAKSEKALIDLYSVMNQLAEQLALAKTEVWISNCNGRPFLLPGLPFWHRQTNHMPWRYLEEMAVAVRRVARLLNTAIFTFEDGFDQQLREVLGPWYPPALMPTLAAACYAAIQELCDAFPGETSASGQGLAAYSVAVQSLVDMSDQQRQRVKGAFKRHKSRVGARKSWASIIDSVLEEQRNQQLSVVNEDGEQQPRDADQWQPGEPGEGSPFGRAASVSGSEAGGTAVGGTASELIGGKAKGKHKREASFGNWIMRVSSSLGQQQGSLSGLDFAAAAAAATAAAAGDEETGSQNGSVAASVAGASEAGSQAGAGAAHGTSPVKLAGQAASAGRGVGLVGVLGSLPGGPFDVPAESAEQHLPAREPSLSFSVQPPPNMLSRASMLRQGGIIFNSGNTMPLTLFPDTTQGRLAQVSFFSFMFLCEELREQLEGLHAAVDAVLLRLPS